ncbi:hypothetical protein PIB19_01475 [Sphingomonas sp. 7/4-4]|uniref:hypothetical protein n=1 Tax=Sphingomonas sp. 7/4-4 TaxID=3018446 RepID=UPI0022F3F738|nr:hypothetical protein [Sphingomonas sp. 7/4-4]WBY08247.1 hypothetical protein PIB19_01475 [Sphingomonas sp. 7/4-4]
MIVRLLVLLAILAAALPAAAGTIEHHRIDAASLRGNPAGVESVRGVTVYLPDGYAAGTRRLPVLYYLSSFSRTTGHRGPPTAPKPCSIAQSPGA